jgi:hypothetical protein
MARGMRSGFFPILRHIDQSMLRTFGEVFMPQPRFRIRKVCFTDIATFTSDFGQIQGSEECISRRIFGRCWRASALRWGELEFGSPSPPSSDEKPSG